MFFGRLLPVQAAGKTDREEVGFKHFDDEESARLWAKSIVDILNGEIS